MTRPDGGPIGGMPSTGDNDGDGGGHRWLERGDQRRTRAAVTNQGADLQPMVQDTGAAGAQIDTQIFKGQVSAATGVPVHQLGDSPQSGLSTLASLDGPLQAMIEDVQDDWKSVIADILGYMLAGEGLDPDRVLVKMPPILMRDVNSTASMLISAMTAFDPSGSKRDLHRWVMSQILELLGETDPQAVLDHTMPTDYVTPYEQRQSEILLQGAISGGAVPPDGEVGGHDERQASPVQVAARAMQHVTRRAHVARNQGLRGVPAPGESLDRAQRRVELARESAFIHEASH